MTDILLAISIPLLICSYAAVGVYAVHLYDKLKRVEKQLEVAHFNKLHCETKHSEPEELAPLLGVVSHPTKISAPNRPSNAEILEIIKRSLQEDGKNS